MEELGVFGRKVCARQRKLAPVLEAIGLPGLLRLMRNMSRSSPMADRLCAAIDQLISRVITVGSSVPVPKPSVQGSVSPAGAPADSMKAIGLRLADALPPPSP